jgi:hypothetical protein
MRLIGMSAVAVALVVLVLLLSRPEPPPTFTCSLPTATARCLDTEESFLHDPNDWVFDPALRGQLTAVDVRPAPSAWATSVDPGFRSAEWAAWIEREDGPPILVACYYSSDKMVGCDTEERPPTAPSN